MLTFDFQGKNSYRDFGIYIEKRPIITSPKRRVEYITIPAKNGSLKFDENTYEDITISIECSLKGNTEKLFAIKDWLISNGEGNLSFSYDTGKVYKAQVVNSIDFSFVLGRASKFIIVFNAKPFMYLANEVRLKYPITQKNMQISNIGTVYSEPIFEITAIGDVTLTINDKSVYLIDIDGKVILNSSLKEVYNQSYENLSFQMQGDFPIFQPKNNPLSITGDVSEFIIYPQWRWI